MKNELKYVRTFENFVANQPERSPDTKPTPARPTTEPGTRPHPGQKPERRSPIRRHKPAVDPRPKAEVEDVISLVNISASNEQKKRLNDYYAKRDR